MTTAAVPCFLMLPFIVKLPMLHGCCPSLPELSLLLFVPFLRRLLLWYSFCVGYICCRGYLCFDRYPCYQGYHCLYKCLGYQFTSAIGCMKTRQKCCAVRKFPVLFIVILWHSFCISDCCLANQHYGSMVVLILTGSQLKFQPTWLGFML